MNPAGQNAHSWWKNHNTCNGNPGNTYTRTCTRTHAHTHTHTHTHLPARPHWVGRWPGKNQNIATTLPARPPGRWSGKNHNRHNTNPAGQTALGWSPIREEPKHTHNTDPAGQTTLG